MMAMLSYCCCRLQVHYPYRENMTSIISSSDVQGTKVSIKTYYVRTWYVLKVQQ